MGQPVKPEAAEGGDHVESLDDIAQRGAELETAEATQSGGVVAVSAVNEAAEIQAALMLLRAAALPFAPAHVQDPLGQVWSDRQLERIAEAVVEICRMHGWTTGEFFDRYGPYIQLLAALGVPALATLKLLQTPPPKVKPEPPHGQHQPA